MKKVITHFGAILFASTILTSCGGGGPDACDCVKQYEYWDQPYGLLKIDQDLIYQCTEYYKDANAYYYPEDLNSAKRNAQKKCD